jgi:hypothetical protein
MTCHEGATVPEKPTHVGDLIKAKDVRSEDVIAAIATVVPGPQGSMGNPGWLQ